MPSYSDYKAHVRFSTNFTSDKGRLNYPVRLSRVSRYPIQKEQIKKDVLEAAKISTSEIINGTFVVQYFDSSGHCGFTYVGELTVPEKPQYEVKLGES